MSTKLRTYHATKEVVDKRGHKHTILVYGELEQSNEDYGLSIVPVKYLKSTGEYKKIERLATTFPFTLNPKDEFRPTRLFNFGWAICDEEDEFDLSIGIELAKKRFSDSPMKTTDVRFFSNDMIKAILENEIIFIEEHLDEKYLHITETESETKQSETDVTLLNNNSLKEYYDNNFSTTATNDINNKYEFDYTQPEVRKICDENRFNREFKKPLIRKHHVRRNSHNNVKDTLATFVNNGKYSYGLIRNEKENEYTFHWVLTKLSHGWKIETNVKMPKDVLINFNVENDKYDFTVKKIKDFFGYHWDNVRKQFDEIDNLFKF